MIIKVREPMSALTHFIGIVFGIYVITSLLNRAVYTNHLEYFIGFLVFGISVILLYSASTIYHTISLGNNIIRIFKKIDHSMIFVLIAGTYTPICLIVLKGYQGNILGLASLAIIWFLAILGIILKIVWLDAPRILYTSQYLLMGWMAIFLIKPLYSELSILGFTYLVLGGISYSIGAIIYARKSSKLGVPGFGFHEIFHCFVLFGTIFHYLMMTTFI